MKALSAQRIANDKVNIRKCAAVYNKLFKELTAMHHKLSLIVDVDDIGRD